MVNFNSDNVGRRYVMRTYMIASTLTNVSNIYEYTEADDSFSEAYDSLSREPITITHRLTWE